MKKYLVLLLSCFLSCSALADDKDVLQQVFQTLNDKYIDEVSLSDVVGLGFQAMSKEDENIRIAKEKNSATIYVKGRLQKIYAAPIATTDAGKWADFVLTVLDGAKQVSPDLHRKDFELVEFFLYEALKSFDKYSRYYPVLDIGQEHVMPQSYHASMYDNGILYIRLGTINKQMTKDFNKTMEKYQDLKGIILDLRGNKGGYLKYALQIADMFIDDGVMIYTTGRQKGKRQIYRATEGSLYAQSPIVVLVNGETASSAEVIALILSEKQRALLVGSQTYGKGTVQNLYKLANGAHLALTTEQFFSAKNTSIEETSGLRPDVCTASGENEETIKKAPRPTDDRFCPRTNNKLTSDIETAENIILEILAALAEDK